MTEQEFLTATTTGDEATALAALETNPLLAFVAAPDSTPATLLALYHGHKALAAAIGEVKQEKLSIFEAAALGRIRDVAVLLQLHRDRAHEVSQDGYTALHLAAFFGHHYCVRLLLDERANPNAVSQNAMQVTPLHSAVAGKDEAAVEAVVAALLNAKADPNATQAGGFTPLLAAQQSGYARVERLLRTKGAV